MANPNQPPNPQQALSAAELRRRLLASTPPPVAPGSSPGSVPDGMIDMDAIPGEAPQPAGMSWGGGNVLSRLRLPGQQAPVIPPAAPPVDPPFEAPPLASINKRTPISGLRLPPAYEPQPHPGYGAGMVDYNVPQAPMMPTASGRMMPPPRMPGEEWQVEALRLKAENKELRQLLNEMKQLLQEASDNEQKAGNKQQELQASLDEKQREVDELAAHIQAIEEQIASGALAAPPPQPKTRGELEEWADELEKENTRLAHERKRLDADRQQLREDEEALEHQMREMEVSMARERALMARQETELKRLSAEIQHDLEMMQRGDPMLREHMAKFQRRAQDVMQGRVDSRAGQSSAMNLGGLPPKR